MLEKKYLFKVSDDSILEKIVDDEDVVLNHIIFKHGEGLPEHNSNSNVYLVIIKGTMTIRLNDQESNEYSTGNIINIPYGIKMKIDNNADSILEFFVVKAPNPKNYGGK